MRKLKALWFVEHAAAGEDLFDFTRIVKVCDDARITLLQGKHISSCHCEAMATKAV